MIIKDLKLINHRNYINETIEFHLNTNILVGNNAQGKTNLLEAIYILARGSSFKNIKENNLINFDAKESYIRAEIDNNKRSKTVEVKFSKEDKKRIKINDIEIENLSELRSQFGVVLFSPEDLKIIKEGPNLRRKFIDDIIINNDISYRKIKNNYSKILNQRNNLLKSRKKGDYFKEMLKAYDKQLVDYGSVISIYRYKYTEILKSNSYKYHGKLTAGKEKLLVNYNTNTSDNLLILDDIKRDYAKKMEEYTSRDIEMRNTFIGPHKDDIDIFINDINVREFGSQGQQRTTLLSLKLGEIGLIETVSKTKPIVLLDDVFSELDNYRSIALLESIEGYQNLITTNSLENLEGMNLYGKVFQVDKGKINWEPKDL